MPLMSIVILQQGSMSADLLRDEISYTLWWRKLVVFDASTTEPMRKGNKLSLTDRVTC